MALAASVAKRGAVCCAFPSRSYLYHHLFTSVLRRSAVRQFFCLHQGSDISIIDLQENARSDEQPDANPAQRLHKVEGVAAEFSVNAICQLKVLETARREPARVEKQVQEGEGEGAMSSDAVLETGALSSRTHMKKI